MENKEIERAINQTNQFLYKILEELKELNKKIKQNGVDTKLN